MSHAIRTRGAKKYITSSHRQGDKVVQTHVGRWTDPIAQLWYRKRRLEQADYEASIENLANEIALNKTIETAMDQLSTFASHWESIASLNQYRRNKGVIKKMTSTKQSKARTAKWKSIKIPSKRALAKLLRLADEGDRDAQSELNVLIEKSEIEIQDAFQPVQVARRCVIESLSGCSYAAQQTLQRQIDSDIGKLMQGSADDPLTRMYSEITAVAYLDATRCALAASRAMHRRADETHFQKLFDRALRRFDKIVTALKKHRAKHAN